MSSRLYYQRHKTKERCRSTFLLGSPYPSNRRLDKMRAIPSSMSPSQSLSNSSQVSTPFGRAYSAHHHNPYYQGYIRPENTRFNRLVGMTKSITVCPNSRSSLPSSATSILLSISSQLRSLGIDVGRSIITSSALSVIRYRVNNRHHNINISISIKIGIFVPNVPISSAISLQSLSVPSQTSDAWISLCVHIIAVVAIGYKTISRLTTLL